MWNMEVKHFISDHPDGPFIVKRKVRDDKKRWTGDRYEVRTRIACMPAEKRVFVMMTPTPSQVNCAKCRETDDWKKADAERPKPKLHPAGLRKLLEVRHGNRR